MRRSTVNKGNAILLITAAVWGAGLVSQQAGMEVLGPWSFTAVRCMLSGICLIPLVWYTEKKKTKSEAGYDWKRDTKATLLPGLLCLFTLGGCIISQQIGLQYTSCGKAAFVTAFYIFLTPVIGVLLRKKVTGRMWFAVAIAMAGLYLITMTEGIDGVNRGDMWMLSAAVTYAIYLHVIDGFPRCDPVKLSCIQFLMIGATCAAAAFIIEPGDITWSNCIDSAAMILYAGVVSGAIGFTLQLIGQKYTDTNSASIILSSETVFSLFAGWIFLNEILDPVEYIGCAVMVVAIAITVIPGKNERRSKKDDKSREMHTQNYS